MFGRLPVQPLLQKYFRIPLTRIKSISFAIPSHTEGRFAIVTDVGNGMRWTRQRWARDVMAGRADKACERSNGVLTNGDCSGRQSRVVLAPVAGVKFAEASRPDRALTKP